MAVGLVEKMSVDELLEPLDVCSGFTLPYVIRQSDSLRVSRELRADEQISHSGLTLNRQIAFL